MSKKINKQASKQTNIQKQLTSPVLEFREGLDCKDYRRKNSVCFPAKVLN